VRDDDLGVLVDDAEDRGRRGTDARDLLGGRVAEGVAAEAMTTRLRLWMGSTMTLLHTMAGYDLRC